MLESTSFIEVGLEILYTELCLRVLRSGGRDGDSSNGTVLQSTGFRETDLGCRSRADLEADLAPRAVLDSVQGGRPRL